MEDLDIGCLTSFRALVSNNCAPHIIIKTKIKSVFVFTSFNEVLKETGKIKSLFLPAMFIDVKILGKVWMMVMMIAIIIKK